MIETAAPSKLVLTLSCPDQPGIVHAVSGVTGSVEDNIIQSQQFGNPDSGLFFMRVEIDSPIERAPVEEAMADIAKYFEATWNIDDLGRPLRTIIMVSRESHCPTGLLYRQRSQGLPIEAVTVVGNHPDPAPVAQFYGVPPLNIPVTKDMKVRTEAEFLGLVRSEDVKLIVLARYMQTLSEKVCEEITGRIINIHHSFLPSFKGARSYAQAHGRDVKLIGATAHHVIPDLDEGPIIEQDVTHVTHTDSTPGMVSLGQDVKRRVLAQATRQHVERRVLLDGARAVVFARRTEKLLAKAQVPPPVTSVTSRHKRG